MLMSHRRSVALISVVLTPVATATLLTPLPSLHPTVAASAHSSARRVHACDMKAPPPAGTGFEKFLGGLIQTAEVVGKAASEAADEYVNGGWQVKKRAGSILPEVRPNSQVLDDKAVRWLKDELANGESTPAVPAPPPASAAPIGSAPTGLAGATGELAMVDQKAASLVTADGEAELQTEFVSFLAPREGAAYKTNTKGEISARRTSHFRNARHGRRALTDACVPVWRHSLREPRGAGPARLRVLLR